MNTDSPLQLRWPGVTALKVLVGTPTFCSLHLSPPSFTLFQSHSQCLTSPSFTLFLSHLLILSLSLHLSFSLFPSHSLCLSPPTFLLFLSPSLSLSLPSFCLIHSSSVSPSLSFRLTHSVSPLPPSADSHPFSYKSI